MPAFPSFLNRMAMPAQGGQQVAAAPTGAQVQHRRGAHQAVGGFPRGPGEGFKSPEGFAPLQGFAPPQNGAAPAGIPHGPAGGPMTLSPQAVPAGATQTAPEQVDGRAQLLAALQSRFAR